VQIWVEIKRLPKKITNLTWSELRSITNSTAAKMTVLIPIIGYLIIFNQHIVQYLNIIKQVGGDELPVEPHASSRLLLVYLGLTVVAVGAGLYQLFCPPDVKYYGDTNAYVGGVTQTIKEYRMRQIEERLRESIFADRLMHVREMYKGIRHEATFGPEEKAEINNGILHLYFEYLNKEHAATRSIAAWAFSRICNFGDPVRWRDC
jgi:hypothetical protein